MTKKFLIWMDLETTGFDVEKDDIVEVGLQITDPDLHIKYEGSWVVNPLTAEQTRNDFLTRRFIEHVRLTNPWAWKQHTESGLFESIYEAPALEDVEATVHKVISDHCRAQPDENGRDEQLLLAGSSIWFERLFMKRGMPKVEAMLGHRNLDVSSLDEFAALYMPAVYEKRPQPKKAHRASPDIRASKELLRYYREQLKLSGIDVTAFVANFTKTPVHELAAIRPPAPPEPQTVEERLASLEQRMRSIESRASIIGPGYRL